MDWLLLPLQILLVLALAPLLQGFIKTTKARLQGRRGPGLLQSYRDLGKLLAREQVISDKASWVYRWAPAVYAAAMIVAAALVPMLLRRSVLAGIADAIVLVGLFALARFALAIAAFDTGSNFGGMGASREISFAALVEPAFLLVLFAAAMSGSNTNLTTLVGSGGVNVADLLAFGAMLIVVIAETSRIPIDNPDTHLELTMAHEGMILDYSGRQLGILTWATQVKQLALVALMIALFLPWGMADTTDPAPLALLAGAGAFVLKAAAIGLLLAVIETSIAKLRIFRAPDLLGLASVLGILAVMASFVVTK